MKTVRLLTDVNGWWVDSSGAVHEYGGIGQEIELPDDQAEDMVAHGWAELVRTAKAKPAAKD